MTTPAGRIGGQVQGRERTSEPTLTLLMGADGAGKTSWRRGRQAPVPDWFFDPEWVADGVGDWNTDDARRRADELIANQIDLAMARRDDFGIETTYADERSRALVERASRPATASVGTSSAPRRRRSTSSGYTAEWRPTNTR